MFYLLLVYIFDVFGRVPELFIGLFGNALYQTPILVIITGIAALLTGRILDPLRTSIGKYLLAYIAWLVIVTPFSYWRTASLEALSFQLRFFVFFFLILILTTSLDKCRKLLYAIAASTAPALLIVYLFGEVEDGRLQATLGRLANPNELAGYMLMLIPLCLFVVANRRYNYLHRAIYFVMFLICVGVVMQTGSRGGIISFSALILMMLWFFPPAAKARLVLGCGIAVFGALLLAPSEAIQRYLTVLGETPKDSVVEQGASGSAEARFALLRQSMHMTVSNPLFGVGPGTFAASAADESRKRGHRAMWQVAHNAYTQVSAEAGLPALIFFCGALICALRNLLRGLKWTRKRPELEEVRSMHFYLLLSVAVYCVTALFSSIAGEYYFYILLAATAVLHELTKARIEQLDRQAVPAEKADATGRPEVSRIPTRRPPLRPGLHPAPAAVSQPKEPAPIRRYPSFGRRFS